MDYGPQPSEPIKIYPSMQPSRRLITPSSRDTSLSIKSPNQTAAPTASPAITTNTTLVVPVRSRNVKIGIVAGAAISTCILVGLTTLSIYYHRGRRIHAFHRHETATALDDIDPMMASAEIGLRVPVIMFMTLISGLFIAVGQHLFYANLHGQEVPNQRWKASGIEVTSQQLNIALGTALAFIVKMCLVSAVSTSYTQAVWSAAKLCSRKQGMSIAELDAVFECDPRR